MISISSRHTLVSLGVILLAAAASGQSSDLLHFSFNAGSGSTVTNHGSFGGTGTIVKSSAQTRARVPGMPDARGARGYALAGSEDGSISRYAYLDTGWGKGVSGDLTIAWHMKRSSTPRDRLLPYYMLSGLGTFRLYHDGNAHLGLKLKSWGGAPTELVLGSGTAGRADKHAIDLVGMAAASWVHVALVIDETAATATYYVNGTAVQSVAITGKANIPKSSSKTLRFGMHLNTGNTSCYDLDNFRLSNRAVPASEIAEWAAATLRVDRFDVSRQGGGQLLSVDVGAAYAGKRYLLLGALGGSVPGTTLGGVHLPLTYDSYTELTMLANPAVFKSFHGTLDAGGRASASVIVPASGVPASAVGVVLRHSALIYDGSTFRWLTGTNSAPLVIFP